MSYEEKNEFLERWEAKDPTLAYELVARFNWTHPGDRVLVTASRSKHRMHQGQLRIGHRECVIQGHRPSRSLSPSDVSKEARLEARRIQMRLSLDRRSTLGRKLLVRYEDDPAALDELWDPDAIDGVLPLCL